MAGKPTTTRVVEVLFDPGLSAPKFKSMRIADKSV